MATLPNNTNYSLNQVMEAFEEIANTHAMINSFATGVISDIENVTVENYPLFFVFQRPGKVSITTLNYSFRLYIMDLILPDESNIQEVRSDTIQTLWDIIFILRDQYDYEPEFEMDITPFKDDFVDKVTGWYVDMNLELPRTFGYCDIPTKPPPITYRLLDFDGAFFLDSDRSFIDWY